MYINTYYIWLYINQFNLSWEIIFVSKDTANFQIDNLISLVFNITNINYYFMMVLSAKQSWTIGKIEMWLITGLSKYPMIALCRC